ncbi:GNAT family N-acetyltransferase [Companilactobacillus sp. HBUAS56275]|uniref:GNAT family N-acetyltransferase n=1 Tax=Candidatus Companilactobacillus pullicola TaxID=2838523 RepID=A0A9D1ZLT6_9LACO|nr:GNAT family N-acetyltransferase [Candidatus Companilactobacillus pullicola]
MAIREAKISDLDRIMELIGQAQNYFKANNIDQWQNNYPTSEVILADIHNHECYVIEVDRKVLAIMTLTFTVQPEYSNISGENWKINSAYATIHRVAVDNESKGQGLATELLDFATAKCSVHRVHSLRTDTYENNKSMQHSLLKNGFDKRGVIQRAGVADMIGFEKIIK